MIQIPRHFDQIRGTITCAKRGAIQFDRQFTGGKCLRKILKPLPSRGPPIFLGPSKPSPRTLPRPAITEFGGGARSFPGVNEGCRAEGAWHGCAAARGPVAIEKGAPRAYCSRDTFEHAMRRYATTATTTTTTWSYYYYFKYNYN